MAKRAKNGQFVKGSIGNPNGRPKKGETLTDLFREYFESSAKDENGKTIAIKQAFIKKVVAKAINEGDMTAAKMIWNYFDGMPTQKVDVGSSKLDELMDEIRKI